MNYLLSFIHLLKWLFYPTPKPNVVGVVDAFAIVSRETGRDWKEKVQINSEDNHPVTDMFSASAVTEPQVLQNTSSTSVDENSIESTSVAALSTEATSTTVVQVLEANTEPERLDSITPAENQTISSVSTRWMTVQLQQQVTLANLHELQQELSQSLGKRVQLSGSQVQRVDTAALQLLVAFMHSSEVSVCWIDHSPALRQAASLLGMSTLLNLPE